MTTATTTQDLKQLRALDVMTLNSVTIREDATIQELIELLAKRRIWGVPVVDEADNLVGVVSLTDLVREENEAGIEAAGAYYQDYYPEVGMWGNPPAHPDNSVSQLRVRDLMSYPAITASPDETLDLLVKRMLAKRIHRIIVTLNGRITGLVTTVDILKQLV